MDDPRMRARMIMRTFFVVCGLVAAALTAASQTRLVDAMETPGLYTPGQPELNLKWTGTVALDTGDFKEGKGSLRFDLKPAPEPGESYPQWGRTLDPQTNDWTHARALSYWVKVVAQAPNITEKSMCIVVYNGNEQVQQFTTHVVPVGQWVHLTDDILRYHRDKVSRILIYMYSGNDRKPYTWWIDDLELTEIGPDERMLDGTAVCATLQPPQAPLRSVQATDGLRLGFDRQGRVAQVACGKTRLSPAGPGPTLSGFLLRDWRKQDAPTALVGTVTPDTDGLTVRAARDGVDLSAHFAARGDRLHCHATVKDVGREDRPLTLYFAMPVKAGEGWTWWDDIATSRPVAAGLEYITDCPSTRPVPTSLYPFACLGGPAAAVSLATPADMPRCQRIGFSGPTGLYYVAYDFCLSSAASLQNQSASFDFDLYASDPAWGLRSTIERYYRYYPGFFARRSLLDGGIAAWGDYGKNPAAADLGFKYHWGSDASGMTYDNQHGIKTYSYVAWNCMHLTMEGYNEAGNEQILERARFIADPNRKEPLPRWKYSYPYSSMLSNDYDGFMRQAYAAYLKSLIMDPRGYVYGVADRSEFDLLVAKYIPFNGNPGIPGGMGQFILNVWWPALEKWMADHGIRMDGLAWDNFDVRGNVGDYRREHFAFTAEPLWFDRASLQPYILAQIGTLELEREVSRRLHQRGQDLCLNVNWIPSVPATNGLCDSSLTEASVHRDGTYRRIMSYHKPVFSLPGPKTDYEDPYVRDHLLYGFWPGGYGDTSGKAYVELMKTYVPILRRENAAGWEPVPLTRADRPQVQVERFGGEGGRELLVSLKNTGKDPVTAQVTLDAKLKSPAGYTELVSGQKLAATKGGFTIELPPGQVMVVAAE